MQCPDNKLAIAEIIFLNSNLYNSNQFKPFKVDPNQSKMV